MWVKSVFKKRKNKKGKVFLKQKKMHSFLMLMLECLHLFSLIQAVLTVPTDSTQHILSSHSHPLEILYSTKS